MVKNIFLLFCAKMTKVHAKDTNVVVLIVNSSQKERKRRNRWFESNLQQHSHTQKHQLCEEDKKQRSNKQKPIKIAFLYILILFYSVSMDVIYPFIGPLFQLNID